MSKVFPKKGSYIFSRSNILSVLFFLLFVSALLPATVQYSVAFWILIFFIIIHLQNVKSKQTKFKFWDLIFSQELRSLFTVYTSSFVVLFISLSFLFFDVNEFPWFFDKGMELKKFTHYLLKFWCFPVICFCLVLACKKYGINIQKYGKAFVIWYVVYFVYCLLQRNFGFNWIRGFSSVLLEQRLMAGGVYRLNGFMSHPLSFSYNLLLLFMLSVGLFLRHVESKDETWKVMGRKIDPWFVLSGIFGLMLFISGSRLAVILATFFILAVVFLQPTIRVIYKCLITFMMFLFFALNQSLLERFFESVRVGQSFADSESRFKFWEIHWEIFNDYRWTGTGLSSAEAARLYYFDREGYTGIYDGYNAHNIFLQNFADFGVWGFLSTVMVFGSYVYALRLCLPSFPKYYLALFWFVVFVGGIFQNHLRDSEFNFALVLCFAILFALSDRIDKSQMEESNKGIAKNDSGFLRQSTTNCKSV